MREWRRELLPDALLSDWQELEVGESLEARIVKAADKLQMMTKALIYGEQGFGHHLELVCSLDDDARFEALADLQLLPIRGRARAPARSAHRPGPRRAPTPRS